MSEEQEQPQRKRRRSAPDPHRLLPQNVDAERGVIGAMLIGGHPLVEEAQGELTPEHFVLPAHQTIFRAICEMWKLGRPVDFIALTNYLRETEELDTIPQGAALITEAFGFIPTCAMYPHHAKILRRKLTLRRIIQVGTEFASRGYDEQDDPEGLLEEFQAQAVEIGTAATEADALQMVTKAEVFARLDVIEERYRNRGKLGGLSTGLVDLDRMLDGLKGKHVYVFAGRPGMGKSAIGTNIAEHICISIVEDGGGAVAFFSGEMPREQIIDRVLFKRARLSLQRIKDGFMAEGDFPKLAKACQDLYRGKLIIDDTAGLTIAQFRSRARRAVTKHKAKCIVVDYVQIMKGSSKRAKENRALEIGEIMQGIRETAKQLDVPVIALAQVGRGAEERSGSRPTMADLRESGDIENEANVVALLYRPSYYAKTDAKRAEIAEKYHVPLEDIDEIAEIEIAKQRNGAVGTIQVRFLGELTAFESRTDKLYSNNEAHRQKGVGE